MKRTIKMITAATLTLALAGCAKTAEVVVLDSSSIPETSARPAVEAVETVKQTDIVVSAGMDEQITAEPQPDAEVYEETATVQEVRAIAPVVEAPAAEQPSTAPAPQPTEAPKPQPTPQPKDTDLTIVVIPPVSEPSAPPTTDSAPTPAPTPEPTPAPTPAPTPEPTPEPEPDPEPEFDINYWISYAQNYATGLGLNLDSTATACWDNPISAGAHSQYLSRDIQSRLDRYSRDGSILDVWIWAESNGNGTYNLYIGYA